MLGEEKLEAIKIVMAGSKSAVDRFPINERN
jgi:hypothetical protein